MSLQEYIELVLKSAPEASSITFEVCVTPNCAVTHNSENRITFTINKEQ